MSSWKCFPSGKNVLWPHHHFLINKRTTSHIFHNSLKTTTQLKTTKWLNNYHNTTHHSHLASYLKWESHWPVVVAAEAGDILLVGMVQKWNCWHHWEHIADLCWAWFNFLTMTQRSPLPVFILTKAVRLLIMWDVRNNNKNVDYQTAEMNHHLATR